eukprot:950001_1
MFGGISRKGKYSTDDFTAQRDARVNQLKSEMRQHIRCLSSYEQFSEDWFDMVDSLQQVARVACVENSSPLDAGTGSDQKGRNSGGTLWDQERDEIAVRTLLEEGKLNLCLRLLFEFKEMELQKGKAMLEHMKEESGYPYSKLRNVMEVFEESVGLILQRALSHVEALQIIDMPMLVSHCRNILKSLCETDVLEDDLEKRQQCLVFSYLECIAKFVEKMDEDRVMDLVSEMNIVPTALTAVRTHYDKFELATLQTIARFLAGIFGTETFVTEPDRFLPDESTKKDLLSLKILFVDNLATIPEFKRKIRPLLDNLRKMARKFPDSVKDAAN